MFSDDVAVNDHVQGRAAGAKLVADEQEILHDGYRFVQLVSLFECHFELLESGDHRSQQHQSDKTHLERLGGESAESLGQRAHLDLARLLKREFLGGQHEHEGG